MSAVQKKRFCDARKVNVTHKRQKQNQSRQMSFAS